MNIKKPLLACYIRMVDFFSAKLKGKSSIAKTTKKIHYFLITHFFKHPFAIIRGKLLFLHKKDKVLSAQILWRHSYENFTTDFIKTKINPGDTVLDIGANIGYFTVLFSEWVGKKGKVFAFEPEERNYHLLKKNIHIDDCKNVVLEQKAVSEKRGKLRLFLNEEHKGAHSFTSTKDNENFIEVETVSLNGYFYRKGINVDFIKMDIEGAEPKALRGAEELFSRTSNLRGIFEFNPYLLKMAGENPLEFLSKFITWGYKLYRINSKGKKVKIITPYSLIKDTPVKEGIVANIYFEKK